MTPSLLLAALLGAVAPGPRLPTLAREDTIALASGTLPEVVVRAPRVTLDEILRRVHEGETWRDARIADQAFTATVRVVRDVAQGKPQLVSEAVTRVYKKKPDRVREVPLRRWPPKKRVNAEVDFSPSTGERIISFAFRPEARHLFRYRILGREIVAGHVIYRVGFEPRSPMAAFAPRGTVWIDTNEFLVLRQEVEFERSPVPLVFKSIDRMVVERAPTRDGLWALSRILMRARTTLPLPGFGSSFDVSLLLSDYETNVGREDPFFDGPGGRRFRTVPGGDD